MTANDDNYSDSAHQGKIERLGNPRAAFPLQFEAVLSKHNARVAKRMNTWPVTRPVRSAIYARDNGRCYYCGSILLLTIDHKTPQCVGGSNHSHNLVTACRSCNCAKGGKHLDAFINHRFGGDAA